MQSDTFDRDFKVKFLIHHAFSIKTSNNLQTNFTIKFP